MQLIFIYGPSFACVSYCQNCDLLLSNLYDIIKNIYMIKNKQDF